MHKIIADYCGLFRIFKNVKQIISYTFDAYFLQKCNSTFVLFNDMKGNLINVVHKQIGLKTSKLYIVERLETSQKAMSYNGLICG